MRYKEAKSKAVELKSVSDFVKTPITNSGNLFPGQEEFKEKSVEEKVKDRPLFDLSKACIIYR